MKKDTIFIFFAIFIVAAFLGCKKSDPTTTTTGNPANYPMTATLNGISYKSAGCSAVLNGDELTINSGTQLPYIFLILQYYSGNGTYTIAPPSLSQPVPNAADLDSSTISTPSKASYGTITITGTSPNITGTFNFTAFGTYLDTAALTYGYVTDSVIVTNGNFTAQIVP